MTVTAGAGGQGLAQRLWIYQGERLPLGKTAVLLALFTAASINVSAALAGVPRPGFVAYLAAFIGAFVFFAHLRVCDEIKDAEDDRRFRPERPVPRGLVSIKELVVVGLALIPLAFIAAVAVTAGLVWLLLLVWAWMALMTVEFFGPAWLKARPVVYLASHMLIMPLIDLFVTACEWLPRVSVPPAGLWLFLVLSFVNGCVLEIGRKIFAPTNERPGVETYSHSWGIGPSILVWCAAVTLSAALLVAIGARLGVASAMSLVAGAGLMLALGAALPFKMQPDATRQKRLDLAAGLWVALCYAGAGFLPILLRATS